MSIPGPSGRTLILCALLFHLTSASTAQSPAGGPAPLPELGRFLDGVRRKLVDPETVLSKYEYRQRVTQQERDGEGRVRTSSVDVYDVRPVGPPGDRRHRVLIEEDGRPLPAGEPGHLEAEHRRSAQEWAARRAAETPDERRRRLDREAAARRDEEAMIGDVFRLYDFRLVGRDIVRGEPVIVMTFTGRPDAPAQTSLGRLMRKTAGRAWIGEEDCEVVRLEIESRDTMTYGLGFLARVRPGATLMFERQRTSEGSWVPASYHLVARILFMLVRPMQVDRRVEFYDFRRPTPAAGSR